jgi:hypothetical protein
VIPSALGVNPFLTISALTERFAELRIRNAYPAPPPLVSMSGIHALDAIDYNEGQLEALFRRCPTMGIDTLVNKGGAPKIDVAAQTIRNDDYWKGFFPEGQVLNPCVIYLHRVRKQFFARDGKYGGMPAIPTTARATAWKRSGSG